jgi:hypothetical protein
MPPTSLSPSANFQAELRQWVNSGRIEGNVNAPAYRFAADEGVVATVRNAGPGQFQTQAPFLQRRLSNTGGLPWQPAVGPSERLATLIVRGASVDLYVMM